MNSCLGQIIRVNLTTGLIGLEEVPAEVRRDFIGGRGLGINYLYRELPAGIDPLGPANKLILVNGALTGTNAQGMARWLAMTKSPLTGAVGKASCGGYFGAAMKFAGLDGIIIEGSAAYPVYLYLNRDQVEIRDAVELWGLDTQTAQERLRRGHPRDLQIACIGPAGENMVRYAAIVNGTRTAARCGVGTVMGAKYLKAIAISASGAPLAQNSAVFKDKVQEQVAILKDHPRRKSMTLVGTTGITGLVNELGIYPVKNFQEGTIKNWEELSSDGYKDIRVKNTGCFSCMTRCGQIYEVKEGPYQGIKSEGPEYETSWAFGGLLGNTDVGSTVAADALCDSLGLDTISTGNTVAFAFELFEKGILTTADTGGLELTWGNHQAFMILIEQICYRRGLGKILAEGVKRAAISIGRGTEAFALHGKGLEFGGYDPRGIKGYALSYATSNIGASHMYGRPREELYGKMDRFTEAGKGHLIAAAQTQLAFEETANLCSFGNSGMTTELLCSLLEAAVGTCDFAKAGERILCLERAFNVREGFSRADDCLPERFTKDEMRNAGAATGMKVENLDGLLDEFYAALGYDRNGIPTPEKLAELGLDWVKLQA